MIALHYNIKQWKLIIELRLIITERVIWEFKIYWNIYQIVNIIWYSSIFKQKPINIALYLEITTY